MTMTMMGVMSMASMLAPLAAVMYVCRGMNVSLSLGLICFTTSHTGLQTCA